MGRLSGNDLRFIASHIEDAYPEYKTQIYFCFDSVQHGEEAFDILKRIYSGDCNYNNYGIDKRDFYLGFTSKAKRNEVMKEFDSDLDSLKLLQGSDLEYIATHYEKISDAYNTQIYFCFDSKESGAEAFDILKRVYAKECNYDAWSGWFGAGDKRDFYLGFNTRYVRNLVLSSITHSVSNFRETHPDAVYHGGGHPETVDDNFDPDDDPNNSTDWTTYIIIGAAAMAILILLWPSKKK